MAGYVKKGPFQNNVAAPPLSAAFFDGVEAALAGTPPTVTGPAATGVAATDTTNLQTAFAAASASSTDLVLPPGTYVLNAPLTWNVDSASLYCAGQVRLDFGALTITGPAFTITGTGNTALPDGPHRAVHHVVSGFQMVGPNTDTTTVDGILITDVGIGNDQAAVEHVMVYGFRDGFSYGDNVWSIDHRKVAVANSHRYGINFTMGANAGECMTYTGTSVYGTKNTAGTGAALYAPANTNTEVRFFGGSLDYNDTEGRFQGGAITFFGTHIEDNGTGAMFTYSATAGAAALSVAFRDCAWDSSTSSGIRDHIHEVLASTSSNITITFDGDKGGVYPNTSSVWLLDNSGQTDLNITSTVRNFAVSSSFGSGILLGDYYNLLTNGSFSDSSAFVATPGVGGWYASSGAWTIGGGGQPGAGLTVTAGTATSGNTQQRIPLGATRQAVRVGGKVSVSSYTSGNVGLYVQFYAADGTTAILGTIRIGSTYTAVTSSWQQIFRRFVPPKGAAYMTVLLNASSFVGTAMFDQIEVVPV